MSVVAIQDDRVQDRLDAIQVLLVNPEETGDMNVVEIAYELAQMEKALKAEMNEAAKQYKLRVKQIEAKYKAKIQRADALKETARAFISARLNDRGIRRPLYSLTAKAELKPLECVQIDSIYDLPEQYLQADTTKIKAALHAGLEVPGASMGKKYTLYISGL